MSGQADLFKLGMRRLAAGVSLITTRDGTGGRHGLIATSVTSVSLTPPSLLVCINKSVSSYDALTNAGVFCVNLLPEGADDIAMRFSSSRFREMRFAEGNWGELETGSPVLENAIASFDCRITTTVDAASHTIFIGEVVGVCLPEQPISPLLYLDGAFARCAPTA
ncbi:flavin reductase family protein [Rhizobium rhizogenes]|uniref:flavin reductase family protein n=1 Tax=Rhizobium rhizogenes TaxID=359 RepID=UPI0015736B80|nr:flavin reductase family protein [Rhizobium rhizogenes]NTI78575.1 flavin reductase [Rhizobium rhizogenes]